MASRKLSLRITDQESARVVAIHNTRGDIVGCGCLLDSSNILTCRHVAKAALSIESLKRGMKIKVTLAGVEGQPTVVSKVVKIDKSANLRNEGPENDFVLLKIFEPINLNVQPAEFACPLRHGGKNFSVLGFPGGIKQGRNVRGHLFSADASGLVQMDRGGALSVLGGFSGAPVWSPELFAFVGIVVTEQSRAGVSWCIPSRLLCRFHETLPVRFRIPPEDRPVIHDYYDDDPNKELFGITSKNSNRELIASFYKDDDFKFAVDIKYRCIEQSKPRGEFVTFITYPDFRSKNEDAYELFSRFKKVIGKNHKTFYEANQTIFPKKPKKEDDLFTIAAIGDAGDTLLTIDLVAEFKKKGLEDRRAP